jgi:hypothetical protein
MIHIANLAAFGVVALGMVLTFRAALGRGGSMKEDSRCASPGR